MAYDPFLAHEALHTLSIIGDSFERHIAEHSFIKEHFAKRADEITAAIYDLYQAVGVFNVEQDQIHERKYLVDRLKNFDENSK